jgi:hypothetical protein
MNKFAAIGNTPTATRHRGLTAFADKHTMANSVSTLGLEPELFLLTTGTFNLVVKDRTAFPPQRRVFSPERVANQATRAVLETV